MNVQATLPFLFPPGGCAPGSGVLVGGESDLREVSVRRALERAGSAEAAAWRLDPYRGGGGLARPAERSPGLFGRSPAGLVVRRGIAAALERQLHEAHPAGEPILLGGAGDPYPPVEERLRVTRSVLEVFTRRAGLELTLVTRSPLILRDLDLLTHLDRRHALTVELRLWTLDPALAHRLEPRSAPPGERLATLTALASEGLATRLRVSPLAPGINDTEEDLKPLFEAAREAGAFDVAPRLLKRLSADLYDHLVAELPSLKILYRRLYGRRGRLHRQEQERLLTLFRRLRLEHGFPAARPGRG